MDNCKRIQVNLLLKTYLFTYGYKEVNILLHIHLAI